MPRRSIDVKDHDSSKDVRLDLPMSTNNTQSTADVEDVSITSSTESHVEYEPNWPRSWQAYTCWLGCFFLMFNSWGLVNAYGTFSSYYVGNSLQSNDQLELNLIGSTESFLVLLFSAPVGRLLDAGHFRWVVGTGAVLVPLGMFMLSVAHPSDNNMQANYALIWFTQGVIVGLGMACYFVSSSQIAATWFPNRKGLAIGFVACGASIAGVVYPTMTRYLIDALGFNDAVRCVAALVTITSIFSLIFATPNPAHSHPRPQSYRALKTWIDVGAFTNKAYCWYVASIAFLFFGFYPVFFNLEEWASVSGFGTRSGSLNTSSSNLLQTFWLLTILNGASTIGRLTMASFADKTGALNMHIVAQLLSSGLVLTLWVLAGSTGAAIAFCICFGITSGMVIGLPPASVANILQCSYADKHVGHSKLGQWTGMMYSVAAIPSLTGPVIAGYLVSEYKDYITVQAWSGANLFISALCMIMTRLYLPCQDGSSVGDRILHIVGKTSQKGDNSDSDGDMGGQTRVPSQQPSEVKLEAAAPMFAR